MPWACGTCTVLNENDSFLQCYICHKPRYAKRKALDDDQGVSKRAAIDLCDSDDDGGDAAVALDLDDEGSSDAALARELAAQDERAAAATQLATQRDEALARSLHAAEVTPDGDEKSLALARRLAAEDAPSVGADLAMAQAMDIGDKLSVARDFERDRQLALEEQEKERHAQALAAAQNLKFAREQQEQYDLELRRAMGYGPAAEDASPPPETAPRRREFVGDRFLLNELHAEIRDQEGARDAPSRAGTVSPDELLWHTPSIERALFTTYGCNYQFLAHMLRGSPCVFTPGKVVVVDEYDHSKYAPAVHPPSPDRPFTVVHPKFYEDGAAQSVRGRLEKGTMHPKLWVLVFRDFCRVVIASSNLGAYDCWVNNQYWVHDFPRARDAAAHREHVLYDAEPAGDVEAADAALAAAIGDAKARPLLAFAHGGLAEHHAVGLSKDERKAVHDWCETRGLESASHDDAGEARRVLVVTRLATTPTPAEAERDPPETFDGCLRAFVYGMLRVDRSMALEWDEILKGFDLTPPDGVHFIGSVPGFRKGPFSEAFGHRAIRRALDREGLSVARAEFANSSLGSLNHKGFLRGFATSLFGTGDLDRLKIVWPSQAVAVRSSRRLMLHAMTDDKGTAQMKGPDDSVWRKDHFPKKCFAHYHAPSDRQTLHHTKMLALVGEDEQLVAVVGGSHNCSGAAWGVGGDKDANLSVVMSYEAGVLVTCAGDAERRSRILAGLPWQFPAPMYDLAGGVEPWSGSRLTAQMQPSGAALEVAAAAAGAAADALLGDGPRPFRVFRGPFPKDGGCSRAVVARRKDVPVFRESLEAYVEQVGGKKDKAELKSKGRLCAKALSANRSPIRTLHAGERVFVDGKPTHFDYDHARHGMLHIMEWRLSDGSGFAHTGSGAESDLDDVDAGDGDPKPALAIFLAAGDTCPPALRAALDDERVAACIAEKFAGVWVAVVDSSRQVVDHAEVAARKIFDFVRYPALGGVIREERCLVCPAEETAAALKSPADLVATLVGAAAEADKLLATKVKKRDEEKRREAAAPLENAKAAAAWLRRNYDVVVIEPEGVLKKPGNTSKLDKKLTESEKAHDKQDYFKDDAVPLLRELVSEPRVEVVLATAFGQLVTDPALASQARKTEDKIRKALSDLDDRLNDELDGRAGFDVLVSWRCSEQHERNYTSRVDYALEAAKPPPESEVAAAVAGGPEACARRIFDEDEAFEGGAPPSTVVRRAAEWSPEFAGPFRLQTAVALAGLRRDIERPRAIVVGAEHVAASTARAAKLDYIGVGKLCSGGNLDRKKLAWDSVAADVDAVEDFG